jgi:aryl-alcohol dehydrogenase-like predicted oxidoreductase
MRYRQLGRTGFKVSQISLGTVEIGMPYGIAENGKMPVPDETAASELLHHALDRGINFIDTARAYGESEAIIGRALRRRRKEYILASKVLSRHGQNLDGEQTRNLTVASVRESLQLLQTDVIDVMMIHCGSTEVLPNPFVLDALQDLKREGRILSIGASVYGEDAALALIRQGAYDCLQLAYSVLDRRPESSVFALARDKEVGVVARSVLLKGALTSRYRSLPAALSELKAVVQRMETLAAREGMSLPELAYRYILGQEIPHTALAGTGSMDELDQVIEFSNRGPLSDNQIAAVRVISMPDVYHLNPGNWPAE